MNWQPFDTAPEDGHYILIGNEDQNAWTIGFFNVRHQVWVPNAGIGNFTHWCPVPELPPKALEVTTPAESAVSQKSRRFMLEDSEPPSILKKMLSNNTEEVEGGR